MEIDINVTGTTRAVVSLDAVAAALDRTTASWRDYASAAKFASELRVPDSAATVPHLGGSKASLGGDSDDAGAGLDKKIRGVVKAVDLKVGGASISGSNAAGDMAAMLGFPELAAAADVAALALQTMTEAAKVAAERQNEVVQGKYQTGGSIQDSEVLNRIARRAGQDATDLVKKTQGINEKLLSGKGKAVEILKAEGIEGAGEGDPDKAKPMLAVLDYVLNKGNDKDAQVVAQQLDLAPYLALRHDGDNEDLFKPSKSVGDGVVDEVTNKEYNKAKEELSTVIGEVGDELSKLYEWLVIGVGHLAGLFRSLTPKGMMENLVGLVTNISGGPDRDDAKDVAEAQQAYRKQKRKHDAEKLAKASEDAKTHHSVIAKATAPALPKAAVPATTAHKELITSQQRLINSLDRNTDVHRLKEGTFGGGQRLSKAIPAGLMWNAMMDSHLRDGYNLGAFAW